MPQQERGLMWGFQLWVNLPAARKLVKPRYQDLAPEAIVELAVDDAQVRLIAGEAHGRRGPVDGIVTQPQMLDVKLPARGTFRHPLPPAHSAFIYVFEGKASIGTGRATVAAGQLAVLSPGDVLSARSVDGARLRGATHRRAGRPLRPVRDEHRGRAATGDRGLSIRAAGGGVSGKRRADVPLIRLGYIALPCS
jgi:hypothetical protein